MKARVLTIVEKHKQNPNLVSSVLDFTYREEGEVNASFVMNSPETSLYCFDDERREVLFVEIPAGLDLASSPFAFITQFEHAIRLYALSYQTFINLARQLPDLKKPVFIYTTGRAASTLLHHALNKSRTMISLSEADAPSFLSNLRRDARGGRDQELQSLAHSAVKFLFKAHHRPGVLAHALKFRCQSIQTMDLFNSVFPNARNVFLYREPMGYVNSGMRVFLKQNQPDYANFHAWQTHYDHCWGSNLAHLRECLDNPDKPITLVKQLTLGWIAAMEWYGAQIEKGTPVLTLSHAELTRQRCETLNRLFQYAELPVDGASQALTAFEKDSQAGTFMARDNPNQGHELALDEEQLSCVETMVQGSPPLRDILKKLA